MTTITLPDHVGISADELLATQEKGRSGLIASIHAHWMDMLHQTDAYEACPTTPAVWAAGDPETATLLTIGEGPGAEEVKTGIPLVGPSGQCFSDALAAAGISRARDCFITNAVTFAPPPSSGDKIGKPRTFDLLFERDRVIDLIAAVRPRAVLLLGKYAYAQLALEAELVSYQKFAQEWEADSFTLSPQIGANKRVSEVTGCPSWVLWHPSYLLRLIGRDPPRAQRVMNKYMQVLTEIQKAISTSETLSEER